MKRRALALVAVFALGPGAGADAADPVSGTLRYNDVRVTPRSSFAYVEEMDGKAVTTVALAEFDIDRAAVMKALDPRTELLAQVQARRGNIVLVKLAAASRCGVWIYLVPEEQSIGLSDDFPLRRKEVAPGRVAGECRTRQPGKLGSDTYEFALVFDVDVPPFPRPAVLGAGGGEPGAAFQALLKAIREKSAAARLHVPKDEVPTETRASELGNWFYSLSLNYPKEAMIQSGLLKGDLARLEYTGRSESGGKVRGTVDMSKADGSWRVTSNTSFSED